MTPAIATPAASPDTFPGVRANLENSANLLRLSSSQLSALIGQLEGLPAVSHADVDLPGSMAALETVRTRLESASRKARARHLAESLEAALGFMSGENANPTQDDLNDARAYVSAACEALRAGYLS